MAKEKKKKADPKPFKARPGGRTLTGKRSANIVINPDMRRMNAANQRIYENTQFGEAVNALRHSLDKILVEKTKNV